MEELKGFLASHSLWFRDHSEIILLYFILGREKPFEVIDTEGKKYKITVEEA
jgi:hypothetical protein